MKIVFLGTPKFGAIILKKLAESSYKPILAVTALDKPVGRKQTLTSPQVKILAESYKIPVLQPEKIRNLKLEIRNLKPDLIIVAAYGQIIPQDILEIPCYGSLNVHPSLLPKYRGAAPAQFAILNGDKETGVTIILMDAQMDHGPIISQKKTRIGLNESAQELRDRLAILGAELLIDTVPDWIRGEIKLRPQNETLATYTKILKREDGEINWTESAKEIERQIRAFNPWPGSYTVYKNKKLKILKAEVVKDRLIIKEVQPEGKKPMGFKDFLRGHPNFKIL